MFTLVPSAFFDPASERDALAEVASLGEGAEVKHIDIPEYDAVLICTADEDSAVFGSEMVRVLKRLKDCPEYNRILCSIRDSRLYLAVAQGGTLLLANAFEIQDFTTAEYYIFLSVKSLQINPEVSTICWLSELDAEEEMSLYRYFKAVVRLCGS